VIGEVYLNGFNSKGEPCMPGLYFRLSGYHKKSGFHSSEFIRLPEQSADEMREENREAIVNIETAIV
jgi:hypothetical protein